MKIFNCMGISPGIAVGPVYLYKSEQIEVEPNHCIDPACENARLENALLQAHDQLQEVYQKALDCTSQKEAEIFEAHMMILEDPEILERVSELILSDHYTAEYAWYKAIVEFEKMIASLQGEVFAERAADIHDVGQRVLRILLRKSHETTLIHPSVIVTEDLTPSDTVGFDKRKVLAFCTVRGGPTSHVSILSKAMGIPAVVGIGPWFGEFVNDIEVIVEGSIGTVILEPNDTTRQKYLKRSGEYKENFQNALASADQPAITLDGHSFEIFANVGSLADAVKALEHGAEGVGLLRTEFLFLDREVPPTEEEQYRVYRDIITQFGQKPVVARTLDIGGDKPAPYLEIAEELNPFLGLRGTRLALKRLDVFHSQIRALLRAGAGHNLKIMFPMIGTVQELQSAIAQVTECKKQLSQNHVDYKADAEIGIMVEIPSAAIMAAELIQYIDFFSIGTNDLTQYTLAADRTNTNVTEFADALDPAVLRLIDMVIKAAHRAGKWVGLCGELAGDPAAVPALLGMHLDEFSMNARAIPFIKEKIRRFTLQETEQIVSHVLSLPSASMVREYLTNLIPAEEAK